MTFPLALPYFCAAHVVDILRGTETDKIARFGHHRLPTLGVRPDARADANGRAGPPGSRSDAGVFGRRR